MFGLRRRALVKEFGQNPEAVLNRLLNGEEQPPGGDLVRQEKHVINAELLREVCRAGGLPDFVGIRPIVWRVLLGYLPLERDQWDEVLLRARQAYEVFCADAVINSPRSASVAELEQDALYLSICKDVNRTLTMFHFFSSVEQEQDEAMRQDSPQDPQSKNFDLNRRASESKGFVFENRHQQALVRILYIYSKLNPGIGYVQGKMYRTLPSDLKSFKIESSERLFWNSSRLSTNRDWFCVRADNSEKGLTTLFATFEELLASLDPYLASHLKSLNIIPHYYGVRWFTTLLSREFLLPDILRVWDELFSHSESTRVSFLMYFCLAMLIISRKRILECNDFADCLMLIQKKLELNIEKLLSLTKLLRKRDKRLLSSLKGLTSPQNLNPPNNEVDSSNPATRIFRVSQIHVEGDNVSQPLEKHSKNSLSLSSLASTDMLSAESLLTSPSLDERKEIELTSEESETNVSRSSSNKNITASNIDFQEFF